jgi:hypothetical protein
LLGAACVDAPHRGEPSELDAAVDDQTDVTLDAPIVHDYDDVIAPVQLVLQDADGTTVERSRDGVLEAELEVIGEAAVELELSVLVSALGHDEIMLELDRVQLEPGEVLPLSVALRDLPLQVAAGDAEVRFAARVMGGEPLEVWSSPLLVRFESDHAHATVTVGERRHGGIDAALLDASMQLGAHARFVASDGSWIAAEAVPPRVEVEPSATDELRGPQDSVLEQPLTRLCTTWRVHYDDPQANQDFLATPGTHQPPASYAQVTIATPTLFFPYYVPGVQMWQGYLDANGCTPVLDLPYASYVFSIGSRLRRDGIDYEIRFNDTTANYNGYSNGNFTVGGAGVYNVATVGDNRATRLAALFSRALVTSDLPIAAAFAFEAYADLGCPSLGSGACYSSSRLYVGNNNFGHDLSARRHVVMHEFGHGVQARAIGSLSVNYATGDSTDPDCNCDHVVSSNNLHCLQSRETITTAFVEGFAHFLAAKVFNDQAGTNCAFGYYKEFRNAAGVVLTPPVAINCQTAVKWMENRGCAAPNRGTEYDWMNFLWDVNAPISGGVTLTRYWQLMRDACGGACGGGGTFTWASFAAAVDAAPDLSATQKWYLNALGIVHGVDN